MSSLTCVSAPHCLPEDSPDPAEVFTVVRVAETKVALKSGYGRYLGVDTAGELVGRAEAVGSRESWEPVFEEVRERREGEGGRSILGTRLWTELCAVFLSQSKLALCASTHRFLTVTEDGKLMAVSEKARDREMITVSAGVARTACRGGVNSLPGRRREQPAPPV